MFSAANLYICPSEKMYKVTDDLYWTQVVTGQ